jgi:hypothetical protein
MYCRREISKGEESVRYLVTVRPNENGEVPTTGFEMRLCPSIIWLVMVAFTSFVTGDSL